MSFAINFDIEILDYHTSTLKPSEDQCAETYVFQPAYRRIEIHFNAFNTLYLQFFFVYKARGNFAIMFSEENLS